MIAAFPPEKSARSSTLDSAPATSRSRSAGPLSHRPGTARDMGVSVSPIIARRVTSARYRQASP